MTDTELNLLPCPMCGSAASILEFESDLAAMCDECGVNYEGPTAEDCAEGWNRRSTSSVSEGAPTIKQALQTVLADLEAMTPDELRAELANHRGGLRLEAPLVSEGEMTLPEPYAVELGPDGRVETFTADQVRAHEALCRAPSHPSEAKAGECPPNAYPVAGIGSMWDTFVEKLEAEIGGAAPAHPGEEGKEK